MERGSADGSERPSRRATASRSTLHAPRSRAAERGEPLGWRFGGPLLALGAVLAVGTIGYVTIEGWPVVDALYMTVMTISTVGFREVHPLSVAGEFFTMALILLGVGALFYAFGSVMAFVFEGHLTQRWGWRRMVRRVAHLDGHIVLCGYGRVGRAIALDLARGRAALVVIDVNQSSLDEAARDGLAIVYGNAADDAVLREAGIERAAALIAATDDDADNIFVTLSARALRADLSIVARANHDDTADKLRRAGASHVVSPYAMAGQRMALLATRPSAVDFVETLLRGADADLLLEDVQVAAGAPLAGLGVAEVRSRFATGATLLALRRGGRMFAPPPVDAVLQAGDILVVAGTDGQLRAVEAACAPR